MNKTIRILLSIILFTPTILSAQTWTLDPDHSKIQFKVLYMSITDVYGEFREYEGKVVTRNKNFENTDISVRIDASSIDTDKEKRDNHLRSEDFFYVEKYPEIRFISRSFRKTAKDLFELTGELTIRGITKLVSLEARYKGMITEGGKSRAAFKVSGTINRFDFGLDWNKTFSKGLVVGKDVDILCEVSLVSVAD